MTLPVIKFTDSTGAPLAGGKVYFFAAGTSTPKDTFTTAAGNVANTNPVILDSQGAAVIFLSGSYKVNVTDSTGAQQANWPVDNITSFSTGASGGTFSDAAFTIQNATDPTKQAMFSLSGEATGTTSIITLPSGNFTVAKASDVGAPLASALTGAVLASGVTASSIVVLGALTDIATNNVSTTAHGFAPKAPNDATKYLDGTGAYSTPASSNAGLTVIATSTPTGVDHVDFTSIPTTYRALILSWNGMSNVNPSLSFQVTANLGNGLGSENASYKQISGSTVTNVDGVNIPFLMGPSQTAIQVCSGTIEFPAYQSGPVKIYSGHCTIGASGNIGSIADIWISGICTTSAGAIQGLRCYWSGAGNFDAGTITLYGVN